MNRIVLIPHTVTPDALRGARSGLSVASLSGETMGTYWKLSYQKPAFIDEKLIKLTIERVFSEIIAQMSHWDEGSELSRFNSLEAGTEMKVSREFFEMLSLALEISAISEGAYDPTVGSIVSQLGFGPDLGLNREGNSKSEKWCDITVHSNTFSISHTGNCSLDLSSIAKGGAVDEACLALELLGIKDYLLEVGGELRGAGCKPDGQPWWSLIGPFCDVSYSLGSQTVIAVSGMSVATSGIAVNSRKQDEKLVHHLIDPTTSESKQGDLISVTVIHERCAEADAWATALFILGEEKGLILATKKDLSASFYFRENGEIKETSTPMWIEAVES